MDGEVKENHIDTCFDKGHNHAEMLPSQNLFKEYTGWGALKSQGLPP
jgi:hypothetical protein